MRYEGLNNAIVMISYRNAVDSSLWESAKDLSLKSNIISIVGFFIEENDNCVFIASRLQNVLKSEVSHITCVPKECIQELFIVTYVRDMLFDVTPNLVPDNLVLSPPMIEDDFTLKQTMLGELNEVNYATEKAEDKYYQENLSDNYPYFDAHSRGIPLTRTTENCKDSPE